MEYSVLEPEAKEADVLRFSGAYLFRLGVALMPLHSIKNEETKGNAYGKVTAAMRHLDSLLGQEMIRLPATRAPAYDLRAVLDEASKKLLADISAGGSPNEWDQPIDFVMAYNIRQQADFFEPVLLAELQISDIYVITKKGGFDTTVLAESGEAIFPPDLAVKVPEVLNDARAAARCIAFDLPTAAAFHLHRVNELVMRCYYDFVTGGKPRPENRNIGSYIDAMKNYQVGDKVVLGALATLKSLHRNPVIHPEQQFDSIEEAIALHGSVRAVVGFMLRALPPPELKLIPPPSIADHDGTK